MSAGCCGRMRVSCIAPIAFCSGCCGEVTLVCTVLLSFAWECTSPQTALAVVCAFEASNISCGRDRMHMLCWQRTVKHTALFVLLAAG